MNPPNGRYMWISHATLSASDTLVPAGTTHIVFGSATAADVYGIAAIKFNGTDIQKAQVPLGTFLRIGSIIPGTSDLLTNATAPASTVTSATFYRWELEK